MGVVNTKLGERGVFSTIACTGCTVSLGDNSNGYYSSATVIGTTLYFTPGTQINVGILDTSSGAFSTADACCGGFMDGTVVGTRIYFTPAPNTNNFYIGVFDPSTPTGQTPFSTIAGPSQGYSGGTAFGKKIYFTPGAATNIGVLDTSTNNFSTISCGDCSYNGATLVGTNIYFTPGYETTNVGVLTMNTDQFHTIPCAGCITSGLSDYYIGDGTALGGKVYFTPANQNNVGVLSVPTATPTSTPTSAPTAPTATPTSTPISAPTSVPTATPTFKGFINQEIKLMLPHSSTGAVDYTGGVKALAEKGYGKALSMYDAEWEVKSC